MTVCFLVGGSPPPDVNETHYLTKARHYWNPGYCPGDAFLDSADPHLTFYWTVGWTAAVLPLAAAAWIGRLAAWGLIAWGWLRLGEALYLDADESKPASRQRWLAAMLATTTSAAMCWALVEHANFAGEWVVGGVEGKCFAYGFVLCALAASLRGDWNRAWIQLGLASAFHVLVGGWSVLAAGMAWASRPRDAKTPLASMAPGLIAGGVIACWGLVPALLLESQVPAGTAAEAARIYVFDRLPHHLAPLELRPDELIRRTMRFGGLVAAFAALAIVCRRNPRQTLVNHFAGGALAFFAAGLLIEAALGNDQLAAARWLRYYWFRLADVAVPLAVATSAAGLARGGLQTRNSWRQLVAAAPLAYCVWFLTSTAVDRWQHPKPRAMRRMSLAAIADWQDACAWVDEHAPDDALFLTPKSAQTFKWYAHRADAGNWKDVPQDAASVVAWRRRIDKLFPRTVGADGVGWGVNSPSGHGGEQVLALGRACGATHVIDRRLPPLPLPAVYTNERYAVYELPARADP